MEGPVDDSVFSVGFKKTFFDDSICIHVYIGNIVSVSGIFHENFTLRRDKYDTCERRKFI